MCFHRPSYLVTLIIIMPMGAMNLDDNIKLQILSFIMLIVLTVEFCIHYVTHGLHFNTVPLIGDDFTSVIGTVIFNLAFVVTIPSWVNEKKPKVSVNRSIWYSTIASVIGYIVVGLLGAWCYPQAPDNILRVLVSNESSTFTRICATLFAMGIIGLGIPGALSPLALFVRLRVVLVAMSHRSPPCVARCGSC